MVTLFLLPDTLFLPLGTTEHILQQLLLTLQIRLRKDAFPDPVTKSKLQNVKRPREAPGLSCQPHLPESSPARVLAGRGGIPGSLSFYLHDMSWMMEVKTNLSPCLRRKSWNRKMKKAMQQRMVDRIMLAWTACIVE